MTYIEALQDAIRKTHGCESRHVESVPVHEEFRGQTVWSGTVEVFDLVDHPKAKQCYAWGHRASEKDNKSRYVVVLKLPPVDSSAAAVKASVVADARSFPSTTNAERKTDSKSKPYQNEHRGDR